MNGIGIVLVNCIGIVLVNDSEVVLANVCTYFCTCSLEICSRSKVVSLFVFACGVASYMMAERATPLPFSPEKVEKARKAINILSRSSSHFINLTFPYYTVCMRGSSVQSHVTQVFRRGNKTFKRLILANENEPENVREDELVTVPENDTVNV